MIKDLSSEYKMALQEFLDGGGEAALKDAYSLGRQALDQGIGVLELASAHHQALIALPRKVRIIKQASEFLAECLSPFEMAQRGYRESIAALNFLNDMLEDEVEKRTHAMRVSEERYRSLIEISPDAITMTDLDGFVLLCNQQSAQMHGYSSPDELIGIQLSGSVAFEDLPRVTEMAEKVTREGVIGELDYTLIRKDGTRVSVEVRVTLLRDVQGKPNGFVGINSDISERKHAQLKLESQARSQAAIALLGQHALSGIDLEPLMRETVNMVADTIGVEYCQLLELLPDGESLVLRDGIGWKDGTIGSTQIKAGEDSQASYTLLAAKPVIVENLAEESRFRPSALLMEHGIVAGMTVIIHGKEQPYGILGAYTSVKRQVTLDEVHLLQSIANILAMAIDNRRLLETESRARHIAEQDSEQRLKSLAIISHELRTPLTSIKGFASTLLAEDVVWDAGYQRDFIQTINDEADKLGSLIAQLLDLSKMEAGAFRFSPLRQRPDDLIAAAMPHLQVLSARHNLIIDIPDTLPEVVADTQRIEQVLDNLVENATKYAPAGTAISISAQTYDGFLEISVADRGPGIAPDEREKIFQPFYRVENKTTIKAKGAGLGLAICWRLVEAHGGHIWVDESEQPGTVISFTLPLAGAMEQQDG